MKNYACEGKKKKTSNYTKYYKYTVFLCIFLF